MPTRIRITRLFRQNVARLFRKYRSVKEEVNTLITQLEQDERQGDKVPQVGYDVYKVRLRNPAAGKGKRGGFRVLYYIRRKNEVLLLTIYAKVQQTDISPEEIRQIIEEYDED